MRQLKESREAVKLQMQSTPLGIVSGGYLDWTLPVDYSSRYGSQTPLVIHTLQKHFQQSLFLSRCIALS